MKRLCITIILILASFLEMGRSQIATRDLCTALDKEEEFSIDSLRAYILRLRIKHPEIVFAQAVLETGEFSSTIFKENNNLFGMKWVNDFKTEHKRPTVAVGSRYGHAVYSKWRNSVYDYLLWQQMFKKTPIETEEQYFRLLSTKYAESPSYVQVLRYMMRQNKDS